MTRSIVVEAWEGNEEPSRRTYESDRPVDAEAERATIEEIVALVHPGARIQSYADGTATFRCERRQIVARFVRPTEAPAMGGARDQESLFAA